MYIYMPCWQLARWGMGSMMGLRRDNRSQKERSALSDGKTRACFFFLLPEGGGWCEGVAVGGWPDDERVSNFLKNSEDPSDACLELLREEEPRKCLVVEEEKLCQVEMRFRGRTKRKKRTEREKRQRPEPRRRSLLMTGTTLMKREKGFSLGPGLMLLPTY